MIRTGIKTLFALLCISLLVNTSGISDAFGADFNACAVINNQAAVYYHFADPNDIHMGRTNTVSTVVDEVISATLTGPDTTVYVIPGDNRQIAIFNLTNTGNGTETFFINIDSQVTKDHFDPENVGIFQDSNNDGIYNPTSDTIVAKEGVQLTAGQTVRMFIVADIPEVKADGAPLQDRDIGQVDIHVTTAHGNGLSGSVFPGEGDCGTSAIYRNNFALNGSATFNVKIIQVSIEKTATIDDPLGGSEPYPGATITYRLQVNATGSGTAVDLVITDQVPANTTYQPGSLILDGEPVSDETDNDPGEATGSPVSQIRVDLGDQRRGRRVITFAVNIEE